MLPTRDRLPCLRETTQSFRPDIDSDRRCLKFVLLPSPARRRGAIIFPFAFTQIPAPVERLAVQRRGRRTSGSLMLLQFPCGDCVRCNGLFDGKTTNFRNFSDEANPILRHPRDSTTSATS